MIQFKSFNGLTSLVQGAMPEMPKMPKMTGGASLNAIPLNK